MDYKHIINQVGTDTKQVLVHGVIGRDISGLEIANELRFLIEFEEAKEVDIRINSVGGSMVEGFGIISAIEHAKNQGVTINTINDGLAASMGALIFQMGDHRKMHDFSLQMFHNPHLNGDEGKAENKEMLNKFRDSAVTIIRNRSGLSKRRIDNLLNVETWLGAQEAKDMGLNDAIIVTDKKDRKKNAMNLIESGASALDVLNMYNNKTPFIEDGVEYPINGVSLAAVLNRSINSKEDREATISRMASSAGISVSTVKQILSASIVCPPISRIESFATTLGISLKSLRDSGEKDGCNYNPENQIEMNKVINHLNLDENATQESVIESIKALQSKVTDIKEANSDLKIEKADLKGSLETVKNEKAVLKTKIVELQAKISDNGETEEIETIVNQAITDKKIKAEAKETYLSMELDTLKTVISSIEMPTPNLLKEILNGKGELNTDKKTFRELEKEDPKQLEKIKNETPDKYFSLYKEEYDVEHPDKA